MEIRSFNLIRTYDFPRYYKDAPDFISNFMQMNEKDMVDQYFKENIDSDKICTKLEPVIVFNLDSR
jgi:hypothetical protein